MTIKSANALRKRYSPAKAVAQTLYRKPVGGGGGGGANVVLLYANATTAPALRSRVCGVGVGGGALTQRHALRALHCHVMAGVVVVGSKRALWHYAHNRHHHHDTSMTLLMARSMTRHFTRTP